MNTNSGLCEVSITANIQVKGYEYIKATIGFQEPYDPTVENGRVNKYYELLEETQQRFLEVIEETKKTAAAAKKS